MKKAQNTQGRVISLFIKAEKGLPLSKPCEGKFLLRARFGIEGDANAGCVGPRQVLLVAMETLQEFKLQPGDLRENVVVARVVAGRFCHRVRCCNSAIPLQFG